MAGMGRPMQTLQLPGRGSAQILTRRLRPFRKTLKQVVRGPYWQTPPSPALQHEALVLLRDAGVRVIEVEDIQPDVLKAAGYRQIMTPSSVGSLTLGHGPDVRRNLMSIKWRNALRKADHEPRPSHYRDSRKTCGPHRCDGVLAPRDSGHLSHRLVVC